jgi:hypothetical protein
MTALETLDLHQNNLQGPLPPSLSSLKQLRNLELSHNNLEGTVPHALGELIGTGKRLAFVHLHGNNLDGTVPEALGNCSYLHPHRGSPGPGLGRLGCLHPPEKAKLTRKEAIAMLAAKANAEEAEEAQVEVDRVEDRIKATRDTAADATKAVVEQRRQAEHYGAVASHGKVSTKGEEAGNTGAVEDKEVVMVVPATATPGGSAAGPDGDGDGEQAAAASLPERELDEL